jgi:hypothetical protein
MGDPELARFICRHGVIVLQHDCQLAPDLKATPGLHRGVSHLGLRLAPQGRPSLCSLIDQGTGQLADGLLMSPVADPEKCAHDLERQAVLLDRG